MGGDGADALARAIDVGRVPGVVAAVVVDGRVVSVRAAGAADVVTGTPVTVDTSYLWFSMTKIVTATTAMRLVERGALDLDGEVDQLVPGVLPRGDGPPGRVRHLLQHSAGIPDPPPIRWVRPAAAPAADPDDFLRRRFRRVRKLRFAPGSRAAYSNLGYLLLGAVIARAAGTSYVDCAQREVMTPLGMLETSFAVPRDRPVATGHQRAPRGSGPLLTAVLPRGIVGRRAGPWVTFRPFLVEGAAYGGLVGPVTDAARVVLLHANGGTVEGRRLLREETVRTMQTIAVTGRPFDHGLGWFRPPADRGRAPGFVEHYGGGGGYHNLMRVYPDHGVGVVVMGNSTKYAVDALVDALAADALRP